MYFPLDIFTHIIVHLDRSSLKSLCLTSQDLVPICRSLLFQALSLNLSSYQNQRFKVLQKFAALLAQSPHLATYVRHLQYSFAGIDSTESQLALTVLKALDRIETLTLANSSHLEALLIPDNLALLVLEIMRSPSLMRLHIVDLPVWILRGVGLGLTSLKVHYDHGCKTQIGARPTKQVNRALVTYEDSIIGRNVSLTSFCVDKHFLKVVRTFGFGSQANRRLDLSELIDIQAHNLSPSFLEEMTTTAKKIKQLDWTSKPSRSLPLVSTY